MSAPDTFHFSVTQPGLYLLTGELQPDGKWKTSITLAEGTESIYAVHDAEEADTTSEPA